ncbi:SatD family protein [soil metagenome]
MGVIGDVVGSRTATDRALLHARLIDALNLINTSTDPVSAFRITVGDEFQGLYRSVAEAVRAVLRLRLALLPEVDVRFGVGLGSVTVLSASPRVEDGSAWWLAREAIEAVAAMPVRRRRRMLYAGPEQSLVNAVLVGMDELLRDLDSRSVSVLNGMLARRSQAEIADDLQVSASAVSQRITRDSLAGIVDMDRLLGEVSW